MARARLAALASMYDRMLSRHRMATSTTSGTVLAFGGDAFAQAGQGCEYDARRAAAFSVFGGVITGPINFMWLEALERWTTRLAPAGGLRALAVKVALQSSILQPFIYLPTFYTVTAIVRRWTPEEAYERVRDEYPGTLLKLWMFWTPSVLYAFGRLPQRQVAVFFAGVGFAWNVVLSLIQNPTQICFF